MTIQRETYRAGKESAGDLKSPRKPTKPKGQIGNDVKDKRERKGHMAYRNNVQDIRLDLYEYDLNKLDYWILDLIIRRTIGWRIKEARIDIDELATVTKKTKNHIYSSLKRLEREKIIIRRKQKHDLFIGLNENMFGHLLIKRHEDALDRRNRFKLVVNESQLEVQDLSQKQSEKQVQTEYQTGTDPVPVEYESCTKNINQILDIIDKNSSLKTVLKDISLKPGEPERAKKDVQLEGGNKETYPGELPPEEMQRRAEQQRKAYRKHCKLHGLV